MSGVLFTPPPYHPHVAHVIKQSNENRTGSPITVADDAELQAALRPSTIYSVRIMLAFNAAPVGNVWRPAFTQTVLFCALIHHRGVSDQGSDLWTTGSNGDHQAHHYDTNMFNTVQTGFYAAQAKCRSCYGVIQTINGGTFSIKWGGANASTTLLAGSFMYLQEAKAA
jgi:hypothetical protein